MRLFSWNVNGIRAVLRKGALQDFLTRKDPDIICIQETKAKHGQAEINFPAYTELWNSAKRAGYSGTAIFTKRPPLSYFEGFLEEVAHAYNWHEDVYGNPLDEGRVQTAEYDRFYLVNVYTPNSKPDLSRLQLRKQLWDPAFLQHLQLLTKHKPVVACGDFNVAHTQIDLARPKDNLHNAGFTAEERQGMDNLLHANFIDTFRSLHPKEQRYTWWTWRAHARERNIGWRIDYFLISKSLKANLHSAEIYENQTGSDHCPVGIELQF